MNNHPRFSLFATDLDGTLLVDREHRGAVLLPRTRRALRALRERGVTLCLASGRLHASIRRIAQNTQLFGPIISCNGAATHLEDGELLEEHRLNAKLASELLDLAELRNLTFHFYKDDAVLARRFPPRWDLYEGQTCSPLRELSSLSPLRRQRPLKFVIVAEPARIRKLLAELKPRFEDQACLILTSDQSLEVMPKCASKGQALQRLAAHLDVPREEIVAVGDGYNDLDMIRFAGIGIAVETGCEDLRRLADRVVTGPEQEGVAAFIEEHLL